jgi:hypothetical protein
MMPSKPNDTQLRMVELLKLNPDGMTCGQLRFELEKEGLQGDEQTHLDRRYRDLPKWYLIEKSRVRESVGGRTVSVVKYAYRGDRLQITDPGQISQKLRAEVMHGAHGQCEMCGRTIVKHGITLVADHKMPRDWGGTNDRENLWAICEECNGGKKAYFASINVDQALMRKVTAFRSVHVRIGELLKAIGVGQPTPSYLIEIVSGENQDDWKKRLRELRYPVIGWEIDFERYKDKSGKIRVNYILRSHAPWPDDPTALIHQFEKEREQRNKGGLD